MRYVPRKDGDIGFSRTEAAKVLVSLQKNYEASGLKREMISERLRDAAGYLASRLQSVVKEAD